VAPTESASGNSISVNTIPRIKIKSRIIKSPPFNLLVKIEKEGDDFI